MEGLYSLGCGRNRGELGLREGGELAFQSEYTAVFLFKPCLDLVCAFTVEGDGNDGLPFIGGKVSALAVTGNAVAALLLRLSPLSLGRRVMSSFSLLHTSSTKFTRIIYHKHT